MPDPAGETRSITITPREIYKGAEGAAARDESTAMRQMIVLLAMLWGLAGIAGWSAIGSPEAAAPDSYPRLDPNTAPWWQLSSLPQIGDGLAKDIVAYREKSMDPRPFRRAADLEAVPGIGPKTVQRLAKYMRFDER